MANRAGVSSAWAKYGKDFNPSLWSTLVKITHWTNEDVQREENLRKAFSGEKPDYVLTDFSELLHLFNVAKAVA